MGGFFKDVLDGKVRDVRKWIENGENVNQIDQYGNTALHIAAEKGFRGVCKVLIDGGADTNQRNLSVGWTAAHYASYEGHGDVLRMLIAHGAVPDLPDSSGDTAETYAREWENTECVTILKEAVAIREERSRQIRSETVGSSEDMFDSDKTMSDESEEEDEEDESSMMNWVMPLSQVPCLENQNNLFNNQFNKTIDNLSIETKTTNLANKPQNIQVRVVQIKPEETDLKKDLLPDLNIEESLDDLVDGFESSMSIDLGVTEGDDNTESEDTLQLLNTQEFLKNREASPIKIRTDSIVDRIKNSLSPAPKRHILGYSTEEQSTKVEDSFPKAAFIEHEEKYEEVFSSNAKEDLFSAENSSKRIFSLRKDSDSGDTRFSRGESVRRERSVSRVLSQVRDIVIRERSNTREVSITREQSVARALSQVKELITRDRSNTREVSLCREKPTRALSNLKEIIDKDDEDIYLKEYNKKLLLEVKQNMIDEPKMIIPDHLLSLSSATIPDDMTMSCCSIIETFEDPEGSSSEKELLLKRLSEVVDIEKQEIQEEILERESELKELEMEYKEHVEAVKMKQKREEHELMKKHQEEKENLMKIHSEEEETILDEISKLEAELQNLLAPAQLLSTLSSRASRSSSSSSPCSTVGCSTPQSKAELADLEQELQCCSCSKICKPPNKIYQCPEGDLICQQCKETGIESCALCGIKLSSGILSRNKVLENIARKYFKSKTC